MKNALTRNTFLILVVSLLFQEQAAGQLRISRGIAGIEFGQPCPGIGNVQAGTKVQIVPSKPLEGLKELDVNSQKSSTHYTAVVDADGCVQSIVVRHIAYSQEEIQKAVRVIEDFLGHEYPGISKRVVAPRKTNVMERAKIMHSNWVLEHHDANREREKTSNVDFEVYVAKFGSAFPLQRYMLVLKCLDQINASPSL